MPWSTSGYPREPNFRGKSFLDPWIWVSDVGCLEWRVPEWGMNSIPTALCSDLGFNDWWHYLPAARRYSDLEHLDEKEYTKIFIRRDLNPLLHQFDEQAEIARVVTHLLRDNEQRTEEAETLKHDLEYGLDRLKENVKTDKMGLERAKKCYEKECIRILTHGISALEQKIARECNEHRFFEIQFYAAHAAASNIDVRANLENILASQAEAHKSAVTVLKTQIQALRLVTGATAARNNYLDWKKCIESASKVDTLLKKKFLADVAILSQNIAILRKVGTRLRRDLAL